MERHVKFLNQGVVHKNGDLASLITTYNQLLEECRSTEETLAQKLARLDESVQVEVIRQVLSLEELHKELDWS